MTDRFTEANRAMWDDVTAAERSPAALKLDAFREGADTLQDLEIAEVGDVSGKRLLHLQCHFGLDTLSWARRGAVVTGVDFSAEAITRAQALAEEVGLDASFICADVLELPSVLTDRFDVVYTSFGVLGWLSDLTKWAQIVADRLEPGGVFYIAEYHPITFALDSDPGAAEPRIRHPYFVRSDPVAFEMGGGCVQYGWPFGLGAVVTAIARAGLHIEFLHEFPFSESQHLPFLVPGDDKWWLPETVAGEMPLLFSLCAHKPSAPSA